MISGIAIDMIMWNDMHIDFDDDLVCVRALVGVYMLVLVVSVVLISSLVCVFVLAWLYRHVTG